MSLLTQFKESREKAVAENNAKGIYSLKQFLEYPTLADKLYKKKDQ